MSIPLDRLYHYIESVARDVYGDTLIYRFSPHGSKKIEDLNCIKDHAWSDNSYLPHLICYDQEPLNYDLYINAPVRLSEEFSHLDPAVIPKRNIRIKIGNIYDKCLLLHSERNSAEVIKYQQDQFVPVYYWSHAIIARDWFRYAPYVTFSKNVKKTFLIYNRAWTGTREYRLKFADMLIDHQLVDQCQTSVGLTDQGVYYRDHNFINPIWKPTHHLEHSFAGNFTTSCYSADFDIDDYNSTDFEVVLETLFDDQRQQLTEKILRPIACKQPFILASSPGSLEYLRSYGFQTFDSVFDESYDSIQDPFKRMESIIKAMKEIASWSPDYKIKQMEKVNKITEFNQQHFFSNQFFDTVITELKDNLTTAFDQIETTNIGSQYRDLKIRNIPGMREYRKTHLSNATRYQILQKIREYRRRNRTEVK
jgi:hypothetical protein